MFDSPDKVENRDSIDFDVCIVGAGAAGITLALELDGTPLRVGIFEAGGFEPPQMTPDHSYAGENIGRS